MPRPKAPAPKLRYHISGQSVVTINERDYYLGKHDTPESLARYAVLIKIYQSNGLKLPDGFDQKQLELHSSELFSASASPAAKVTRQADMPILVRHVTAAYIAHAEKRYANSQAEVNRIQGACNDVDQFDGDLRAAEYGPRALQKQRQRWIDSGKSRQYCNRLTCLLVRAFKWAVSQELVGENVWTRLRSVESLRFGEARETDPVTPVALEWVRATAKELTPVLRAMVRIHVATGMRPSELCQMRPGDVDRSGEEWIYRPAKHKGSHRKKSKAVPIVGDAREALASFLDRSPDAFCFSPKESEKWRHSRMRELRKSKVQPSQIKRALDNPRMAPGDCYDKDSYRRAIRRAAARAGVPHWFPYQLRHLAGTVVRDVLGGEATQALLGHAHMNMTDHYAKITERKAIAAAHAAPTIGDFKEEKGQHDV